MSDDALKAPFPYMGGKSQAAHLIWGALGDVTNFVEPFAGSAATLLARPLEPRRSTTRMATSRTSGARFRPTPMRWRSTPIILCWRTTSTRGTVGCGRSETASPRPWRLTPTGLTRRVWGMGAFVPGAWCVDQPRRCKPECAGHFHGKGVHGISLDVKEWMRDLQARLRRVRVLCGDYKRAVSSVVLSAARVPAGKIGVFFDPPYAHAGRDARCYGKHDSPVVFDEVVAWSVEHANEDTRIVIAGYDSRPMPEGWREVAWRAHGGLGRRVGNENNARERLWLSPACLDPEDCVPRQQSLFGGVA